MFHSMRVQGKFECTKNSVSIENCKLCDKKGHDDCAMVILGPFSTHMNDFVCFFVDNWDCASTMYFNKSFEQITLWIKHSSQKKREGITSA